MVDVVGIDLDVDTEDIVAVKKPPVKIKHSSTAKHILTIRFDHFSAYWQQSECKNPTLKSITMSVKQNSLTTVIGSIGSGKSSLIMALLKEMPYTTGISEIEGRVAYVE